jgi:hypothetical protein
MANEREFAEQWAYARLLVERGVLWLALALIVVGMGAIPIGIWADNLFVVTVGMIGMISGVLWVLWLAIPDP